MPTPAALFRLLVHVLTALGAVLALAPNVLAQRPATSNPPVPFNRWDVAGGLGVHLLDTREDGESYTYWDGWWQPRLQVGRYFTPHLKAEFAVTTPHTYEFFEDEQIPVPGLTQSAWAFTEHRVKTITLTPLFTYQFFENSFAHPFVSAGVNVSFLDEQRTRVQETRRVGGVTYMVPALSSRRTDVLVRPIVASGVKAYFNERAFVRPEVGVGFGPRGATQVNLRFDFGFDF